MTQAQPFLPARKLCSLSVAIDEELTRLVDDPRCFAPSPPGPFCGSLSVAICNCPLAAGGCPMTATTQPGGSSTTMVTDQAVEGTLCRPRRCAGMPGPPAQGQPTFKR